MAPPGVWGRTWYVLSCVVAALVVGASGLSYMVVHDVSSIGGSHPIPRRPPTGPQNIPLMGLGGPRELDGETPPPTTPPKLHPANTPPAPPPPGGNTTPT